MTAEAFALVRRGSTKHLVYPVAVTGQGFETPEQAAFRDIPARYRIVLGTLISGDRASVWMLTNDRPPFEPYTMSCYREGGRWFEGSGVCGLSDVEGMGFPPDAVVAHAERYFAKPS